MKPNQLPPDEAAIDSLLRGFFQQELPASLRSNAADGASADGLPFTGSSLVDPPAGLVSSSSAVSPAGRRPRRRSRLVFAVGIASLAVVALLSAPWTLLRERSERPPSSAVIHHDDTRSDESRFRGDSQPGGLATRPDHQPLLVRDRDGNEAGPLFILEGGDPANSRMLRAPVEERNARRANVSIGEHAGPVRLSEEDLRIEILPEHQPVEPRLTPGTPQDTRLPEQRSQQRSQGRPNDE